MNILNSVKNFSEGYGKTVISTDIVSNVTSRSLEIGVVL